MPEVFPRYYDETAITTQQFADFPAGLISLYEDMIEYFRDTYMGCISQFDPDVYILDLVITGSRGGGGVFNDRPDMYSDVDSFIMINKQPSCSSNRCYKCGLGLAQLWAIRNIGEEPALPIQIFVIPVDRLVDWSESDTPDRKVGYVWNPRRVCNSCYEGWWNGSDTECPSCSSEDITVRSPFYIDDVAHLRSLYDGLPGVSFGV